MNFPSHCNAIIVHKLKKQRIAGSVSHFPRNYYSFLIKSSLPIVLMKAIHCFWIADHIPATRYKLAFFLRRSIGKVHCWRLRNNSIDIFHNFSSQCINETRGDECCARNIIAQLQMALWCMPNWRWSLKKIETDWNFYFISFFFFVFSVESEAHWNRKKKIVCSFANHKWHLVRGKMQ